MTEEEEMKYIEDLYSYTRVHMSEMDDRSKEYYSRIIYDIEGDKSQ